MHLAKPTPLQVDVARKLGVSLRTASQSIAAARIHDAIEAAITPDSSSRQPTEKQIRFAQDLGVFRRRDSFRVCSVRIDEELFRRNHVAMRRFRLKPGDVVVKNYEVQLGDRVERMAAEHVVSSIGSDLRVYFKSPVTDSGAWPSQLSNVKHRRADI